MKTSHCLCLVSLFGLAGFAGAFGRPVEQTAATAQDEFSGLAETAAGLVSQAKLASSKVVSQTPVMDQLIAQEKILDKAKDTATTACRAAKDTPEKIVACEKGIDIAYELVFGSDSNDPIYLKAKLDSSAALLGSFCGDSYDGIFHPILFRSCINGQDYFKNSL